jgi:hypothetical protein
MASALSGHASVNAPCPRKAVGMPPTVMKTAVVRGSPDPARIRHASIWEISAILSAVARNSFAFARRWPDNERRGRLARRPHPSTYLPWLAWKSFTGGPMSLRSSHVRRPHRRTLRFEPLESRAYPGALLWSTAWAWPNVGDALISQRELSPADLSENTSLEAAADSSQRPSKPSDGESRQPIATLDNVLEQSALHANASPSAANGWHALSHSWQSQWQRHHVVR